LNREIATLIEREKEWKRKEEKWEGDRDDWKNELETLLEQNTLLLKS